MSPKQKVTNVSRTKENKEIISLIKIYKIYPNFSSGKNYIQLNIIINHIGMNDWDYEIGHWLKDVPYVWYNSDDWRTCSRVYILPSIKIFQNIVSDVQYHIPKTDVTYSTGYLPLGGLCKNFFNFTEVLYHKGGVYHGILKQRLLRVNGVPRVFRFNINVLEDKRYLSAKKLSRWLSSNDRFTCNPKFYRSVESDLPESIDTQDILIGYPKDISHVELPDDYLTPIRGKPIELSFLGIQSFDVSRLWLGFLRKYRDDICLPIYNTFDYINIIVQDDGGYQISEYDIKLYKLVNNKCLSLEKIRYILIPVAVSRSTADSESHANLIIVDKVDQKVYFIDPHGKYIYDELKSVYRRVISEIFDKRIDSYEMFDVDAVCPRLSFQQFEWINDNKRPTDREGYCDIWIIYMVHLIINNPGKDIKELFSSALAKINSRHGQFDKFSRAYLKYIEDQVKELMKMKDADFGVYLWKEYHNYLDSLGITEEELRETDYVYPTTVGRRKSTKGGKKKTTKKAAKGKPKKTNKRKGSTKKK